MNTNFHKFGFLILSLVIVLAIAGCQPAQMEQPTTTPQPTAVPLPTVTPIPSPTATASVSHIYAFGDENSDNGNMIHEIKDAIDQGKMPADSLSWTDNLTWNGRLSDGPLAVEVLAEQLNVDLTDYAFMGASSGYEDENWGDKGLLSQVYQFKSDLNGQNADPDALYFIFVGSNDWLSGDYSNSGFTASDQADKVITNVSSAITSLADLGATRFMVVNSFDLVNSPVAVENNVVDKATEFQSRLKSEMGNKMNELAQQLNVKVLIYDFLEASNQIRSDPERYGFTNISDVCVNDQVCASPSEYFYWSYLSLTHHVHQIVGEAMANQLTNCGFDQSPGAGCP